MVKNQTKDFPDTIAMFPTFLISFVTYLCQGIFMLVPLFFIYLNTIQNSYFIDEKFHVPQAVQYCDGNFYDWDPKITTLPGLYLFSALILEPVNLCRFTWLRFINVLLTNLNFFLALRYIRLMNDKRNKKVANEHLRDDIEYLTAWNITFFPPLFFWFFLYYTEIFSVTLILTMLLFHINNRNIISTFIGAYSIFVRQTNVIWVALLSIEKGLTLIEDLTKKPEYTNTFNIIPCIRTLYSIFKAKKGFVSFFKFSLLSCKTIIPDMFVLLSFVVFIIYNGGIVVGDRTAHKATIHLTQIFYYSLFACAFSWPYLVPETKSFLRFLCKHFVISFCIMCLIALIVHYNTLVHPYILADNRHYSFYIWKNFMNKYFFFKYLLVPIYFFAIYAILKSLSHLRLLSLTAYILCVIIVLVPQLLLEPRYFIIPYILFRLRQKEPKNWQILLETFTTIIVNMAQFMLFINKSFYWEDEKYPQRIGW
ncbi:putative Dol-P-Glc:Glc(2)Man(9)GlcNAc(2)-PP-Dol alpha-1,2-glucosyltransferase [Phymastichus coffea]|uniref:putative Dol-P-Glc:Glc(2)Man(9)GlcNAc(2)-PP-Dol alpha-1,2-glucosyltransferase n=1 Tax=Phymastichus coffea TaxID=108790 RepID=UPI00273C6AA2|nr:putative Dol-P-Glc:Glc(2)Man(9)GlcNAc(2)-PP-Dol alpha-1,2-glucosyltransferase [Phymastichus coffea]